MLSIFKIRVTALRIANMAWAVIHPRSHIFVRAETRTTTPDIRKDYKTWDNPPGIYDPSASPLLLASSKWNDTQMIAAGQINPVRAGSWEDEMHSRFKAPPSSPQVISCHNVPRERDRADSCWELCKANTADRCGPSWCSAPRCSWGDWGPSAGEQTGLPT